MKPSTLKGFCGEGTATGTLAKDGCIQGSEHKDGGALLYQPFGDLTSYLATVDDPRRRALIDFASASRHHRYFDGTELLRFLATCTLI
jgi:hypothetical protein